MRSIRRIHRAGARVALLTVSVLLALCVSHVRAAEASTEPPAVNGPLVEITARAGGASYRGVLTAMKDGVVSVQIDGELRRAPLGDIESIHFVPPPKPAEKTAKAPAPPQATVSPGASAPKTAPPAASMAPLPTLPAPVLAEMKEHLRKAGKLSDAEAQRLLELSEKDRREPLSAKETDELYALRSRAPLFSADATTWNQRYLEANGAAVMEQKRDRLDRHIAALQQRLRGVESAEDARDALMMLNRAYSHKGQPPHGNFRRDIETIPSAEMRRKTLEMLFNFWRE